MRPGKNAIPIAVLVLGVALSGCGDPSGTDGAASSVTSAGPAVKVSLHSPAIPTAALPSVFTCDGKNISPPLVWGAVPPSVEEFAVFALGVQRGISIGRTVEWAMAGVNPALHRIHAGQVPPGAVLLHTTAGKAQYSICPPKGPGQDYVFAIYALPAGIHATPQISGPTLLHNLTESTPQDRSPASGSFEAHYARP